MIDEVLASDEKQFIDDEGDDQRLEIHSDELLDEVVDDELVLSIQLLDDELEFLDSEIIDETERIILMCIT